MNRTSWSVLLLGGLLACASPAMAAHACNLKGVAIVSSPTWEEPRFLKAVELDRLRRPVVVARIGVGNSHYAFHEMACVGAYVLSLFWNLIEIHDFSNPRLPRLVRRLTLRETHASWGGGGIVQDGENLVLLGATFSAELLMRGDPGDWLLNYLPVTEELKRRTARLGEYDARLRDASDMLGGGPRTVPLPGGVFEVVWESKIVTGGVRHNQYLLAPGAKARLRIDSLYEVIH
jgi:hypothetical protein